MPSLFGAWKEDLHLAALSVTDTQFQEREQPGVGGGRSMTELPTSCYLLTLCLSCWCSATNPHMPPISPLPGNSRYLSESYTGNTGWIICIALSYELLISGTTNPEPFPPLLSGLRSSWMAPLSAQFSIFQRQIHSGFLFHFYSLCPTCLQIYWFYS